MCGIAGILKPSRNVSGQSALEMVRPMVAALEHRGPDGKGLATCADPSTRGPDVAFGHTRLAIIDLNERAAQPMSADDGSVWLTFNGEIFNYLGLRDDLLARGHHFRTNSDTEVILRGYLEWGEQVVDRLDGMFAFGIWDRRRQVLLLVRDRLGIKPLYLHAGTTVAFASEVRAILASGVVSRKLDPIALDQYLTYQTVPAPRTLIRDVRLVEPGSITRIDSNGRESGRLYWNLIDWAGRLGDAAALDASDTREAVRARLDRAARSHMISDVPVGVFLSGGIDSSALVSLLCTAGYTPRTFTVAFPGHGVDEAPFARAIASTFGTEHQEITLTESEVIAGLEDAVSTADQPTADGVNTYVVSRAVRQAGVKVAISGLGGDEFFGGYPSFRRFEALAPYRRAWQHSPRVVRRAVSSAVRSLVPGTSASEKAVALLETDGSVPQAYPIMRQLFTAPQRRGLLATEVNDEAAASVDPYVTRLQLAESVMPPPTLMASLSYAEARTYMHDLLLRDTDQMSMRHGLEVRVPLLDHHLVEYVMGLPDDVKQPGSVPKRLLRESLGQPLPAICTDRPKSGFVLPFDQWMRNSLRAFCDRHLGAEGLAARPEFQRSGVETLWRSFLAGDGRTTWARPWALVSLHAWLKRNEVTL
jgi:asparagine synthase (glutamine-hydrolysing)